jgi:hypothetical protein
MNSSLKVLCIGDNSSADAWAHKLTKNLSKENNSIFRGQIDKVDQKIENGFYYTGVILLNEHKIFELSDKFDRIILLDQDIDQYSHSHIFVSTWKLIKYLKEKETNIEIMNKKNMEFLDYWHELMEKNQSFCLYPWIKSVSYNDHYTLCTQSRTPVTKTEEMKNWKTDKNFMEVRKKMLDGQKLTNCQSCYREEGFGKGVSIRKHETLEWAALMRIKSIEDLKKIESPSYFELRFSNKCNIKCRSCNGHFSHLISKENKEIKDKKFQELVDKEIFDGFGGAEIIDWRKLKRVYIGGGESTVQPELYEFLRNCIKNKNTEFEFRIGTNAVKISDKLYELFKPFRNLTFSVSIDGTPKIDDYIRWGTNAEEKINNIKRLRAQGHSIAINFVLSIWNVSRLGEILKYFETEFPDSPVHFNDGGYKGDIISPFNFPNKDIVLQSIKLAKQTKIYFDNEQRTRNLINSIDNYYSNNPKTDLEKLSKFFYYNDTLDKIRGSKLIDYIPELEECRKYIK